MPKLDHSPFVIACRDERGLSRHTLRAYAQDLNALADYADQRDLADPFSREDILAYHRHLRDIAGAQPAGREITTNEGKYPA